MTTLFAQPYDIAALGFYFETKEDYDQQAAENVNPMGAPVRSMNCNSLMERISTVSCSMR